MMSPALALRLVTYLLVSNGVAALLMAGLVGPLGAALVIGAMLGSWWLEAARERGVVRPVVGWGLLTVAAIAIALDLFYLAQSALDGMVHLLLFLILGRLFMRRAVRDLRDAGFLSFFLLVATSAVTFSVGFLFVFVSFLVLGTWMLVLQHVVTESERAVEPAHGRSGGRLGLDGPLIRVSVGAAVITFAIAGCLFFLIPRVGQATLPWRSQLTRMVTGFSDRVDLGAFGEIESDKTVVMRVYVGDDMGDPALLPNLRWRGIALDRFDGRTWAIGQPERTLVRPGPGGPIQVGLPVGRGPILNQDIYLDPIGTDIVFAASRPLRIQVSAGALSVDDMGSLSVPTPSARLHYQVESQLDGPPALGNAWSRARSALSPTERQRYLQLPPLSPAIAQLAREVIGESRDPYEAARKLNAFLSARFHYTLAKPQTTREPLDEFLFVRRSGNCEYFAAALAVMLRTLEIPARVVGGFQRGEWNPYGRYFMVRLSDAHAWVEAHFDGIGWVTFDPSPRALAEMLAPPSPLALYVDAARMRWYRYVVNWSLRDQRLVASRLERQARDASLAFGWPRRWRSTAWLITPMAIAMAGALGWLCWRSTWWRTPRRAVGAPPRFYQRALRALARRGLVPEPAETARQFYARALRQIPGSAEPLGRITTEYERARFGSAELTDRELRELEQCLAALDRR
jgi:transglutaminase-like putative cysteine protease